MSTTRALLYSQEQPALFQAPNQTSPLSPFEPILLRTPWSFPSVVKLKPALAMAAKPVPPQRAMPFGICEPVCADGALDGDTAWLPLLSAPPVGGPQPLTRIASTATISLPRMRCAHAGLIPDIIPPGRLPRPCTSQCCCQGAN